MDIHGHDGLHRVEYSPVAAVPEAVQAGLVGGEALQELSSGRQDFEVRPYLGLFVCCFDAILLMTPSSASPIATPPSPTSTPTLALTPNPATGHLFPFLQLLLLLLILPSVLLLLLPVPLLLVLQFVFALHFLLGNDFNQQRKPQEVLQASHTVMSTPPA